MCYINGGSQRLRGRKPETNDLRRATHDEEGAVQDGRQHDPAGRVEAVGVSLGRPRGGRGGRSGPGARTARAGPAVRTERLRLSRATAGRRQQYTYPTGLDPVTPNTPLDADEMRITFLGSVFPPTRRAQQMMSIFVEVGRGSRTPMVGTRQSDGLLRLRLRVRVVPITAPWRIGFGRMDKVFMAHLHGDHMSDLSAHLLLRTRGRPQVAPVRLGARAFGRAQARAPPPALYDDGTKAFCKNLREALRWHTESFSFQTTSYGGYHFPPRQSWGLPCDPVPVGDDPRTTAMPWSPLSWTGGSTGRAGRQRRLPQPDNRREDHPLPGDPLPKGLHRLQARVDDGGLSCR